MMSQNRLTILGHPFLFPLLKCNSITLTLTELPHNEILTVLQALGETKRDLAALKFVE